MNILLTDDKVCELCGIVFSRTTERDAHQWNLKRFCSKKCVSRNYSIQKRTIKPPNPSGICLCGCGETTPLAKSSSNRSQTTAKGEHVSFIPGHGLTVYAKKIGGRGEHGYGRYKTNNGYIHRILSSIPKDDLWLVTSMKTNFGGVDSVLEHRYFMAKFLGRPLTKTENVHHKNGIKVDNSLDNLELWSISQPSGRRNSDICEHCNGSGLKKERY